MTLTALRGALRRLLPAGPALAWRRLRPARWLTVLAYHRVCEPDPASPWDPDLVSASPAQFRAQLAFLTRHFTPITSAQVVEWLAGRFEMPRNPVVVTFDDGYRDAHDAALPLLEEAGVPADFFVCPWHVERRRPFWWDVIACCARRSERAELVLQYPRRLALSLDSEAGRKAARRALLDLVKATAGLDFDRFTDELIGASNLDADELARAGDGLLMTWDQVRALRRAGMGVGSHSQRHPVLPMAGDETVREELARSKHALENALGEEVRTLAYPVGRFDERARTAAREAGYALAYSYCTGASRLDSFDPYDVRRVPVERWMSAAEFRSTAAFPMLT